MLMIKIKIYELCPGGIHACTWKIETFIEEDTRYKKHCTQDNDTSVFSKVGTLGPHIVFPTPLSLFKTLQNPLVELPSAALSYFPESQWWSEIFFSSKVILVLGKTRSHRAPNLGCSGAEQPGRFDASPENSAWDVMRERAHCCDEAANH